MFRTKQRIASSRLNNRQNGAGAEPARDFALFGLSQRVQGDIDILWNEEIFEAHHPSADTLDVREAIVCHCR